MSRYIADAAGRAAICRVIARRVMAPWLGFHRGLGKQQFGIDSRQPLSILVGMSALVVADKEAAAQISTRIGDQKMANKTATAMVTVTLRKDRRFKTWIARIAGPNTAGKPDKKGRVHEMLMEFVDESKHGENWAEFMVPDGAFYMLAQPAADGSGREVKYYAIRNGQPFQIDEASIRAAFKMAPKASKTASTATPTLGALSL